MPWWSWLVIWGVLVLGVLGMLALFAVRLFRKLMAAGAEVSALAQKAEILSQRADDLRDPPFRSAVFDDAAVLGAERELVKVERADARQARRDARVRRGKLLISAEPSKFTHLNQRN